MSDNKANDIRHQALAIEHSNPRKAINLLVEAIKLYRDTWTVANVILDDVIRIGQANGYWDETIFACKMAQELKPEYRKSYSVTEKESCLLKDGRPAEALETRLAYDIADFKARKIGFLSPQLHRYGDRFTELGLHDRAWQLYNEAVAQAVAEKLSPHPIRQSMARLLLKENKPQSAVELLIAGICEATRFNTEIPNPLVKDLRKALNTSGLNLRLKSLRDLPEEIIAACKTKGEQSAIEVYHKCLAEIKQ